MKIYKCDRCKEKFHPTKGLTGNTYKKKKRFQIDDFKALNIEMKLTGDDISIDICEKCLGELGISF